jgi:hypothetical protein
MTHKQMSRVVYRNLKCVLNDENLLPDRVHNLDCCYHGRPFDTKPVPVVEDYDPERDVFFVRRCACRPECAKSYIAQFTGEWHRTLLMHQRRLMVQLGMVSSSKPIPFARTADALDYKGGHMTLEEWLQPTAADERGAVVAMVTEQPKMVPHRVMLRMTEQECTSAAAAADAAGESVQHDEDNPNQDNVDDGKIGPLGAAAMLKNLSTHNIARPPEDQCIKTIEDMMASYPDMDLCDADPGPFSKWVEQNKDALPSEEECKRYLAKRATEKRAKRAHKKAATAGTAA